MTLELGRMRAQLLQEAASAPVKCMRLTEQVLQQAKACCLSHDAKRLTVGLTDMSLDEHLHSRTQCCALMTGYG